MHIYKCQCLCFADAAFTVCASVVDPKPYIEQCKHDVCTCGNKNNDIRACECNAFATYARECALRGKVLDWRTSDMCGKCTNYLVIAHIHTRIFRN